MELFKNIKKLLKSSHTIIDNNVFWLHYKITCVLLLAFSVLVTAKQYIGDPIDCISKDDFPSDLLDTYCWIETTFSVEAAWHKEVGKEIPYPGVDTYVKGQKRVFHAYYQWVCFVLVFQAILFYTPRYFWKSVEGGRLKSLVLGLDSPILPEETRRSHRKLLAQYLAENLHCHGNYFYCFAMAEMLNLVNVVGQMFLMDRFLGREFSHYGIKVLQFTEWDWSVRFDPLLKVFPRLTKCTFHRYGSSGDVQKHDAMCILPANVINEKIYIFLWFWFVLLALLSTFMVIYRFVVVVFPPLRYYIIKSRARITNADLLKFVVSRCHLGDWLLLDLLCKNLDSINFRDLVRDLAHQLDNKGVDSSV